MPHVRDADRWADNADGSYYRIIGGKSSEVNATEGALDLAASYGIDLSAVKGTGAGGRVTKADVESYLEDDE